MRVTSEMRTWVEMQGFTGLSDQAISDIYYWVRLAPLLFALWAATGTYLESPASLWALAFVSALGAILPRHPFDAVYTFGLRRWLGGPAIPRYGAPRRFSCAIACVWMLATGFCFARGAVWTGRILGFTACAESATLVFTGFCLSACVFDRMKGAGRE